MRNLKMVTTMNDWETEHTPSEDADFDSTKVEMPGRSNVHVKMTIDLHRVYYDKRGLKLAICQKS